jgi:hypothetical protein
MWTRMLLLRLVSWGLCEEVKEREETKKKYVEGIAEERCLASS